MLTQLLLADLDAVRPNGWNPNRMDERHFAAEIASILSLGFVDPITVRDAPGAPTGTLEIVDGEHRHRALVHIAVGVREGRYRIVEDAEYDDVTGWRHAGGGLPLGDDEGVPTLLPFIRDRVIPAVSLGRVSEAEARRLTLVLNETRGSASRSDVARLLDEIESLVGLDAALRGLPFDTHEGEDMLELARYDADDEPPQTRGGTPRGDRHDEDAEGDDPFVHRFQITLSDDDLAVVRAARERLDAEIEAGDAEPLPPTAPEAWGVVVARLASAYL